MYHAKERMLHHDTVHSEEHLQSMTNNTQFFWKKFEVLDLPECSKCISQTMKR